MPINTENFDLKIIKKSLCYCLHYANTSRPAWYKIWNVTYNISDYTLHFVLHNLYSILMMGELAALIYSKKSMSMDAYAGWYSHPCHAHRSDVIANKNMHTILAIWVFKDTIQSLIYVIIPYIIAHAIFKNCLGDMECGSCLWCPKIQYTLSYCTVH